MSGRHGCRFNTRNSQLDSRTENPVRRFANDGQDCPSYVLPEVPPEEANYATSDLGPIFDLLGRKPYIVVSTGLGTPLSLSAFCRCKQIERSVNDLRAISALNDSV